MEDQAEKLREIMRQKSQGDTKGRTASSDNTLVKKDKTRIITITSGKGGVGSNSRRRCA
jgi:Mrp family chromosome partitioning ATPase